MIKRLNISRPIWSLCGLVTAILAVLTLNIVFPPPIDKARQVSSVVNDHNGQWLSGFTVEDGRWRIQADLDEIDPRFVEYLIAIEDKRFWSHGGVDGPAILRALRSWRRAGKPVSGASTITMQMVRQVEPRPRTLKSKVIESLRALQYETRLSKDEILSLYLSHVSYGGNVEGVHAASLIYFGKPPYQLTDAEIALLIALPQAPEARRPDLRPETARKGRDIIVDKLAASGKLSPQQAAEAKSVPVLSRRHPVDETAWLSAFEIKRENRQIDSSLDFQLQSDLEKLAADFAKGLEAPTNLAITVVENDTMSVRAHIASADRMRDGGWINMTERARSPGSTLKPFIYALAMDDGTMDMGSFVFDAPTRFGTYQPENFNRRYHGKVRIFEALQHSLNVPAVSVLDRIGGDRFEQALKDTGIDVTRLSGGDGEKTGLALALGGAGLTVNDLAVIYAALANEGVAKPLKWTDTDDDASARLMSAETAHEITQVLRQSPTPTGRVPAWLAQNAPPIAYKTGTSYGFRDAWAAGYTDEWTVIVWVGRPDGAPRRGETGRKAAAPLLYDVFSRLPHQGAQPGFRKEPDAPQGLSRFHETLGDKPQILFPPDGSEILTTEFGPESRGFTLSVQSESPDLRFYADGQPIMVMDGKAIWRPETSGFYTLKVVDEWGREAVSHVEVLSLQYMADARF